jgi:hexosaminidase
MLHVYVDVCYNAGLQISLWGGLVQTMNQAEYMLYPRLLSAAERAWHVADWEMIADDRNDFSRRQQADWRQFAIAVGQRELRRLDRLGVQYRLPPPGVKYEQPNVIRDAFYFVVRMLA